MVTERYQGAHGVQPVSLLASAGMCAAMVSGLVLMSPAVRRTVAPIFEATNIPLERPKPEPTPELKPEVRPETQPVPRAKPVDVTDPVVATVDPPFVAPGGPGTIGATGTTAIETILPPLPTPTPAPVLRDPSVDPRYARDLQPLYPAGEERAGRTGLVTLRVLVGVDGRVKRAERLAATSDAFWAATERQALAKWRFRPATRDGVAVEGWRTMTVRFEIPE